MIDVKAFVQKQFNLALRALALEHKEKALAENRRQLEDKPTIELRSILEQLSQAESVENKTIEEAWRKFTRAAYRLNDKDIKKYLESLRQKDTNFLVNFLKHLDKGHDEIFNSQKKIFEDMISKYPSKLMTKLLLESKSPSRSLIKQQYLLILGQNLSKYKEWQEIETTLLHEIKKADTDKDKQWFLANILMGLAFSPKRELPYENLKEYEKHTGAVVYTLILAINDSISDEHSSQIMTRLWSEVKDKIKFNDKEDQLQFKGFVESFAQSKNDQQRNKLLTEIFTGNKELQNKFAQSISEYLGKEGGSALINLFNDHPEREVIIAALIKNFHGYSAGFKKLIATVNDIPEILENQQVPDLEIKKVFNTVITTLSDLNEDLKLQNEPLSRNLLYLLARSFDKLKSFIERDNNKALVRNYVNS